MGVRQLSRETESFWLRFLPHAIGDAMGGPTANRRSGFTIVELLVAIAVVSVLLALALPAIMRAREAARRMQCQNNLRQMGTALHAFESSHGSFPPGDDGYQEFGHSWCTAVLPFLDQVELYDYYDYHHAWDDPGGNFGIAQTTLSVFLCPTTANSSAGGIDYGGLYGVGYNSLLGTTGPTDLTPGFGIGFGWDQGILTAIKMPFSSGPQRLFPIRVADIRDGTSHTFLIGEDAGRPPSEGGQWANGNNCFAYDGKAINTRVSNCIFSNHPGGANMLLASGAVIFLGQSISSDVVTAFATRARGEHIDDY